MEIAKQSAGDWMEVRLQGRLDAYWSDHVAAALDEMVRKGEHQIRLNMAGVDFISSAGIRVLLLYYKQLQGLKGQLSVADLSDPVRKVLELSGLKMFLTPTAAATDANARASVRHERPNLVLDVFESAGAARCVGRVIGDPAPLQQGRFRAENCTTARFPESSFALGLGALGEGFDDCQARLGEFLAVAGAAVYQPADGTNTPDFLLAEGGAVPDMHVCYALVCEGALGVHFRFESKEMPATILDIVEAGLDLCQSEVIGFVMAAEAAGLMGAALRRSPVCGGDPFRYPEIRAWLSFTAERVFARALALVVGVAAHRADAVLAPLVRPLGPTGAPVGHIHAAAFTYQPLAKGALAMTPTLRHTFKTQSLQGVLHLLNDPRPIVGGGQSEFARGACWLGPIDAVTRS